MRSEQDISTLYPNIGDCQNRTRKTQLIVERNRQQKMEIISSTHALCYLAADMMYREQSLFWQINRREIVFYIKIVYNGRGRIH